MQKFLAKTAGTITLSTSKARSIPATGVAGLSRRWSARFVIELLVMLIIFQEIMNKNIEHRLDTLLKSDKPMVITPEGGTLSVELNHSDSSSLPPGFFRDGSC